MTSEKKIPNVHSDEPCQKDLLDPATVAVVGAFSWFAIKAAAQGILGWVAVKLFIPVWNRCFKGQDESSNEGVSQKES